MSNLFIDLHVLQTVPSNNMNRDDSGRPKTANFGGFPRARVSSQAWKRATRKDFATYLPAADRGVRTRRIIRDLVSRMQALDPSVEEATAIALATGVMNAAGIKFKPARTKKDEQPDPYELSEYLLFVSNQQIDRLARLALDAPDGKVDKATARQAIDEDHGIEVALFGRMVADDTSINVDASVQVAHAISTHVVEPEYDYYTAVDDHRIEGDDAGAGMIGVVEYNSSTLYRYATINVAELHRSLGDDELTERAVEAFARSFVVSMPSGKQNSFANGTVPDAVLAQQRTTRPVNLVGAFETPVRPEENRAISTISAAALAERARDVAKFAGAPYLDRSYVIPGSSAVAEELAESGVAMDLDAFVTRLRDDVREWLGGRA